MDTRPKTIVCDIDGVLLEHTGDITIQHLGYPTVLEGVKDKIKDWDRKGYRIILLTGRRESTRKKTEKQLTESGIFYDQLVMGVTGGVRVLINDCKPNSTEPTVEAICLTRNEGLKNVEV